MNEAITVFLIVLILLSFVVLIAIPYFLIALYHTVAIAKIEGAIDGEYKRYRTLYTKGLTYKAYEKAYAKGLKNSKK